MLKIRGLVLVIALASSGLAREMPQEMKDLLKSLHDTCVASIGVSEDLVARAQKGDFADDEKVKCYMRCALDEVGVIDDGKVDVEGVIAMLPDDVRDILDPTVRKCGVLVGANECETAFLVHKCFFDDNPDLFFLP